MNLSRPRRTLFVGDVHGCREELELLLEKARWTPRDRLVLVGDLVAKGPDSAGVLERVRELQAQAVLGNHYLHVLRASKKSAQEREGLKPEHRQVLETLRSEDFALLASLPRWLRFPEWNLLVVHAGLVPGVPVERQPDEHLLYLRSIKSTGEPSRRANEGVPWASLWKGPEKVIFGHDAKRGLQRHPFALGLDTGCVYGGALSGYLMPDDEVVSVKATRMTGAGLYTFTLPVQGPAFDEPSKKNSVQAERSRGPHACPLRLRAQMRRP